MPEVNTKSTTTGNDNVFATPCRFIASAGRLDELPAPSIPEVAFAGRSNVGKSSLINAIAQQKKLAYVSQTPGRTQRINIFAFGVRLGLVDLPGYGYARAAKRDAAAWHKTNLAFIKNRVALVRVLLLIDCRRGIGDMDKNLMRRLDEVAVGWTLVLTKCDKLAVHDAHGMHATISGASRHYAAVWPEVFMTSASKATGIAELRQHIATIAIKHEVKS